MFEPAIVGLFAGLLNACWGSYKDIPYEGFYIRKFMRSIVISIIIAIFLYNFVPIALLFPVVVAFERIYTEIWKGFFREESQEKYSIPSKFHIKGVVLEKDRYYIGIIAVAIPIVFFGILLIFKIPEIFAFLVGFIAGFAEAFGGAWKDAPIEGFDSIKFLRSPFVASFWSIIFSFYTNNVAILLFSSAGAERVSVELYKSFIIKSKPAKFKVDKKYDYRMRKYLVIPYIFSWFVFIYFLLL